MTSNQELSPLISPCLFLLGCRKFIEIRLIIIDFEVNEAVRVKRNDGIKSKLRVGSSGSSLRSVLLHLRQYASRKDFRQRISRRSADFHVDVVDSRLDVASAALRVICRRSIRSVNVLGCPRYFARRRWWSVHVALLARTADVRDVWLKVLAEVTEEAGTRDAAGASVVDVLLLTW